MTTMTAQEAIRVLREALERISKTRFGWDGDCGVTSIADDALDATAAIQPAAAPASSDAATRVKAYIERRKLARSIDIDHIHSFDADPDCGVDLLLSDLEALVSESPTAKA